MRVRLDHLSGIDSIDSKANPKELPMRVRLDRRTGAGQLAPANRGGRPGHIQQPKPRSVPRPRPLPKPGTRR